MTRRWLGAVAAIPFAAHAWPVDVRHAVAVEKTVFVKLAGVDWLDNPSPTVASVEWQPGSNELVLEGLREGVAHVLLYAQGKMAVWQVRVQTPEKPAPLEPVRAACPKLEVGRGGVEGPVASVACLDALRVLFQGDGFVVRDLGLTYSGEVLQAQLKRVQAALPKGVTAKYSGAGLVLEGTASPADHRKALWAAFHESVGRIALDDQVVVKTAESPTDAGLPKPR